MTELTWKSVLTVIVFLPLIVALWAGYRRNR